MGLCWFGVVKVAKSKQMGKRWKLLRQSEASISGIVRSSHLDVREDEDEKGCLGPGVFRVKLRLGVVGVEVEGAQDRGA